MPPPAPSLFLLGRRVGTYPPGEDRSTVGGHIITSESKMAFGFLDHGEAESVVRRLKLQSEHVGKDLFFLSLLGGYQYSCIHTVDKNLILIATAFLDLPDIEVLLIYDAIDSSLRMIPSMPYSDLPFSTTLVLVARSYDVVDEQYALVFPGKVGHQEVLFLSLTTSTTTSGWLSKKMCLPDRRFRKFDAHEVFSFRGRGYWVDLLCNVLYCRCSQVLSDDIDCVTIHSLDLPMGCKMYSGDREQIAEVKSFRAMGPVGDSIKFVSIDGYLEHVDFDDCKVRVWTLMPDMIWALECELEFRMIESDMRQYHKHGELPQGFEWDNILQSDLAPMYPFLSSQEDHAIYFALGSLWHGEKGLIPHKPMLMLRLDLQSKLLLVKEISESHVTSMGSHLVVSSNVAQKLLQGSC